MHVYLLISYSHVTYLVYSNCSFFDILFIGNCDNCKVPKKERDMSREAFLLMACIHSSKGNWGLKMPIDILRGSRVSCSKLKLGNVLISFKSSLFIEFLTFCLVCYFWILLVSLVSCSFHYVFSFLSINVIILMFLFTNRTLWYCHLLFTLSWFQFLNFTFSLGWFLLIVCLHFSALLDSCGLIYLVLLECG